MRPGLDFQVLDWRPARWRARLCGLSGWRAAGLQFVFGAFSALAMAPLHFWPALALGLIFLSWQVDAQRKRAHPLRRSFFTGFVFAMGYFMAGTFWVGFAFANRGDAFIPLIPIALPGFAALLSVFWGFAMMTYARIAGRTEWRILAFAAAIGLFEWLRGHIFSGLPWNLPGYAWPAGGAISQSAASIGIYGLSFLTVFMLAAPAVAAGRRLHARSLMPPLIGIAIGLTLFASGALRLAGASEATQPGVSIRLVQSALTQGEKWGPSGDVITRDRYLGLTAQPGLETVTHVIWPEGALPFFMLDDGPTLRALSEMLPDGQTLIAGINRADRSIDGTVFHNAMAVMRFEGGVPAVDALYDKVRLVPFGEMVPLTWLVEALGFEEFARLQFTPGLAPTVLESASLPPVMPLICYEAIFPDFVSAMPSRPEWMLNISNDAWFGDSSGPQQHLNQARYRSIETGLPMIRSASRGISGVIDAHGRMPVRIAANDEGAHDVALPIPLNRPPYMVWGDGPFLLICLAILLGLLTQGFVNARRNRSVK